MTIELNHIIPIPLKDRLIHRSSEIWQRTILFNKGETIKITAPSGAGKSTLIHCIYHLRKDYEGTVTWDGIPVIQMNREMIAQYRQNEISVVFQDLRLFEHLTAFENIDINRVLQKPYYESAVIEEMMDVLGITHIRDQKAGICSYGEQQRIAIIRALMQPFSWLIMDEPFSHLDPDNTVKAVALIERECKKRNAGIIITDLQTDKYFNYSKELFL